MPFYYTAAQVVDLLAEEANRYVNSILTIHGMPYELSALIHYLVDATPLSLGHYDDRDHVNEGYAGAVSTAAASLSKHGYTGPLLRIEHWHLAGSTWAVAMIPRIFGHGVALTLTGLIMADTSPRSPNNLQRFLAAWYVARPREVYLGSIGSADVGVELCHRTDELQMFANEFGLTAIHESLTLPKESK